MSTGFVRRFVILFSVALFVTNASKIRQLEGKHLRVLTVHYPPSVIMTKTASGLRFSGPLIELLDWLSKRIKFSYDLTNEPSNVIGVRINGTWDGLLGKLARNETDLVVFPFTLSWPRTEVLEHVGYIGGDYSALLTPYPTAETSWKAAFNSFNRTVWIAWFFSLVAMATAWIILKAFRDHFGVDLKMWLEVGKTLVYMWGTLLNQGGYYCIRYWPISVLAATWCFTAFVFVNAYSSTLTSYLASSYKAPEVNSLDDLALNPNYKVVSLKGIFTETMFLTAESGNLKLIGDKIRKCPECRMSSIEAVGAKVLQKGHIGSVSEVSGIQLIEADYRRTGKCQMTLAHEKSSWKNKFLAAPKSSTYVREIDQESLWAHAFGLPYKWGIFYPQFPPCRLHYNSRGIEVVRANKPLKLQQLLPPFALLLVGILAAFAALIYEMVSGYKPPSQVGYRLG